MFVLPALLVRDWPKGFVVVVVAVAVLDPKTDPPEGCPNSDIDVV